MPKNWIGLLFVIIFHFEALIQILEYFFKTDMFILILNTPALFKVLIASGCLVGHHLHNFRGRPQLEVGLPGLVGMVYCMPDGHLTYDF